MFIRANLMFCLTVIFFINCNDTESNVEDVIPKKAIHCGLLFGMKILMSQH